jgi:hypothetical protein
MEHACDRIVIRAVLVGKLEGKNDWEEISVGEMIILIWILKKQNGRM